MFSSVVPQTRWTFLSDTLIYFLLLAPALLFLPQFFLPMARSHATFTPSSLLLCCSLLHLLISLSFTSFQLVSLKSSSLFLSSVCSSNSASFILPCRTYCSLMCLILLLPCLCPRAVSVNGEGGKQLHHMLLEKVEWLRKILPGWMLLWVNPDSTVVISLY